MAAFGNPLILPSDCRFVFFAKSTSRTGSPSRLRRLAQQLLADAGSCEVPVDVVAAFADELPAQVAHVPVAAGARQFEGALDRWFSVSVPHLILLLRSRFRFVSSTARRRSGSEV